MPPHQQPSRRRRINGDGSVYKRQDGYWVGAFYASTASGARKRVVVYGKTLDEARAKLGKAQEQARSGIPVPDESWKLGPYLYYWLEHVVKHNRRPGTYALYETTIRLYLIPGLGTRQLKQLSVGAVQMFLNQLVFVVSLGPRLARHRGLSPSPGGARWPPRSRPLHSSPSRRYSQMPSGWRQRALLRCAILTRSGHDHLSPPRVRW